MMKVQIELIEGGQAPEYKTLGANGADLYARLDDVLDDDGDPILCIKPGETKSIPAGFKVEVPDGYAMLILPRSGLSAKTGLRVSNASLNWLTPCDAVASAHRLRPGVRT
jgi:dUTP pyrophosphatase